MRILLIGFLLHLHTEQMWKLVEECFILYTKQNDVDEFKKTKTIDKLTENVLELHNYRPEHLSHCGEVTGFVAFVQRG